MEGKEEANAPYILRILVVTLELHDVERENRLPSV
jgi:hypothetical protein